VTSDINPIAALPIIQACKKPVNGTYCDLCGSNAFSMALGIPLPVQVCRTLNSGTLSQRKNVPKLPQSPRRNVAPFRLRKRWHPGKSRRRYRPLRPSTSLWEKRRHRQGKGPCQLPRQEKEPSQPSPQTAQLRRYTFLRFPLGFC
jgi:hypothetical protein